MDIIRGATVTERAALEYRVDQNKWDKFLASSLLGYVMHFTKNVKNMYTYWEKSKKLLSHFTIT